MRSLTIVALVCCLLCFSYPLMADTPIMGKSQVTPEHMAEFVLKRNPNFDPSIAYAFHAIGERYGIRGDIAFCQGIIETGWYRYNDGTAVKSTQYNFGGIGVTERGKTGNSFVSLNEGVEAMIQHLYAYCTKAPLPDSVPLLDPRFHLVARGIAPNWEGLSNRWAMNPNYAQSILKVYAQMSGDNSVLPSEPEPPVQEAVADTATVKPGTAPQPKKQKSRSKKHKTDADSDKSIALSKLSDRAVVADTAATDSTLRRQIHTIEVDIPDYLINDFR